MTALSAPSTLSVPLRYLRAPFMLVSLLVGFLLMMYLLCAVEVGAWVEEGLRKLGWEDIPGIVMISAGVVSYTLIALILPFVLLLLGYGWLWLVGVPLAVSVAIILIGRW